MLMREKKTKLKNETRDPYSIDHTHHALLSLPCPIMLIKHRAESAPTKSDQKKYKCSASINNGRPRALNTIIKGNKRLEVIISV